MQNEHTAEQVIRANDLSKDFTDVGHATLGQLVRNTAKQINVLKELTFSVEKGELLGLSAAMVRGSPPCCAFWLVCTR